MKTQKTKIIFNVVSRFEQLHIKRFNQIDCTRHKNAIRFKQKAY